MAVRDKDALLQQITTLLLDNTTGQISPADARSVLTDIRDTFYDASTMQTVVLADDVITTAMLAASAVESGNLGDDAVTTAKIADGAVTGVKIPFTAGNRLVEILERLAEGDRLSYDSLDDTPTPVTDDTIRTVVGAMVSDNTETGITVTYDSDSGKINFVVTGGGTPAPASHTRYWARSSDTAFTAAEFLSSTTGQSETDDTFVLPTWSGNEYMGFAVPDTTGDITGINLDGIQQFGAFQRIAGTLTISGTAYKVWRSNNQINFSGATAILTQA